MNRFKNLDTLFPCGKDRLAGEVVSVSIAFVLGDHSAEDLNLQPITLSWKRKAWYVNASVNAWHMHRGLCAEFKNSVLCPLVDDRSLINKLIGDAVQCAYKMTYDEGSDPAQYYEFELVIPAMVKLPFIRYVVKEADWVRWS